MKKDSAIRKYLKWIIFGIIAAYAIIMIVVQQMQIKEQKALLGELEIKKQELTEKIEHLESEFEYMTTDEYIERTARDRLGMVKENEIVFQQMPGEE
ncbi:MAG: septum formation initiator family protein [Christensenellaceae bacterium]|nr:septum formation initiator family protein [Christensenellaceae bacterium]